MKVGMGAYVEEEHGGFRRNLKVFLDRVIEDNPTQYSG